MINLDNLAITISGVDISPMCLNLTILESIKGGIKGSIIVQDNINFYDTFIGAVQPNILIEFKYIDDLLLMELLICL